MRARAPFVGPFHGVGTVLNVSRHHHHHHHHDDDFDFDFDDFDDEATRGGVAFARAFVAFVGGDCVVVVVVARARGSRLSVCSRHRAEYEVTLASSSSSSSS